MNKILFCASTASHIRNFHLPYLKALNDKNCEIWVASDSDESIPYAKRSVAFPFRKKHTHSLGKRDYTLGSFASAQKGKATNILLHCPWLSFF